MKTQEKKELQKKFEKDTGTVAKKIRWKTICVETKEHPSKPNNLITGTVKCIYPTGDIAFSKVTKIELWNQEDNSFKNVKIPKIYADAKKIVIRREIIAKILYIEELEEADE